MQPFGYGDVLDAMREACEKEAKAYGHWLMNKYAPLYKTMKIPEPEATELYQQYKKENQ